MLCCLVKWYYAVGDKPIGPVSRAELESLYEGGTITTATMVLQEGMYDWVPFVDLKKTTQFLPSLAEKVKTQKEAAEPAEEVPVKAGQP